MKSKTTITVETYKFSVVRLKTNSQARVAHDNDDADERLRKIGRGAERTENSLQTATERRPVKNDPEKTNSDVETEVKR